MQAPGIHIQELPDGAPSIEGTATSIALFIGWAPRGSTSEPIRVRSFAEYEREFGPRDTRSWLGYSVGHFFDNGGQDAYVIRLEGIDGTVLEPDTPSFNSALLSCFGSASVSEQIDIFNIVCVPGETDSVTLAQLQKFCGERRAFLVIDSSSNATLGSVATSGLTGPDALNSALYFPWVLCPDPMEAGAVRAFPPCGFVAGVYARTDAQRGVWRAPAGTEASLVGAANLAVSIDDVENSNLNIKAINCLRVFPTYGPVVWGARTLHDPADTGSEWRYVPVRRLALFLEETLYRGTQWAVFEPNDEPLWTQIRLTIDAFLLSLFRMGAFQGARPREAYFVKCDRDTTTEADIILGRVNIIVGFAPIKPAEFVVLKIQQVSEPREEVLPIPPP